MQPRVLITDDVHPYLIEGLSALGYAVEYQPLISFEDTMQQITPYVGLVVNSKIRVDDLLLDQAPHLIWVGRLGSGLDIFDLPACARRGVAVINSPEGNANAVAEQALGMLLALQNNLLRADREVRQFTWQREANRGVELAGKRIGIYGFGNNGSQFARKLAGMEMEVWAYDKYKTDYLDDFPYVAEKQGEDLFECDVISLHLPLTDETHHLVNRSFLDQCRPGAILINTSRGSIVNTADLVEALESGRLKGACLDVFENEKPATMTAQELAVYSRLYALDQVVLSPHIAGWTRESKYKIAQVLVHKIRQGLQNRTFIR